MWHEARKREKATQKLFNDHKKRAEKRRDENRIDPNSLLQVHGIKAKLCLNPSVYKQAVKSLVVWQGDKSVTIDRFDVRATLSSIPTETSSQSGSQQSDKSKHAGRGQTVVDADESESMKKVLNYERYRLLIHSDLNKVPEELRLKLVTDNDVLSDAKMRKLRSNKFGTSGDASISTNLPYQNSNSKVSRSRDLAKKGGGAAIGYTYCAVPPPPCLSDTSTNTDTTKQGPTCTTSTENAQMSYMDILDLVDNDNFDLENVNLSHIDSKRSDETARKYSLTMEELVLLARRDSLETGGATDIVCELDRLRDRPKLCNSHTSGHDSQVYGPALPPSLIASASQNSDTLSPNSPPNSPPVGQRSPSGAVDIPLRNGHHDNESGDSPRSPIKKSPQLEPKSRSPSPKVDLAAAISTNIPIDTDGPINGNLERVIQTITADRGEERRPDQMSPRRASTPLAYKRNCRSNRSLSREKRSRRHRSSRKRHRRTRSPSSFSYSSSSRSHSSVSSYSSKSSRSYRRTSSRRKRKSRSKRRSYR